MKIVYISTVSVFKPAGGRLFEAFCEYDEYLVQAHKVAKEMAQTMGASLSDLRYFVAETREPFGVILSYDSRNTGDVVIEDRRLQEIGSGLLFPDKGRSVDWHPFYDIDVDSYEDSVCDEIETKKKEDVF